MKFILKSFSIIVLLIIFGCVTNSITNSNIKIKPNQIYQGPLPEKFTVLEQRNPLLATEIRKLPEIQNGISPAEASALEKLIRVYILDPNTFDWTFQRMYQFGLPEVRKYCSPLQALFWLAEDEDSDPKALNYLLSNISLQSVIGKAWTASSRKKERWNDFDVVIDRLNSPELIDYYIKWNFTYMAYTRPNVSSPGVAFKLKGGNCVEIEAFQRYLLNRSGYKAYQLIVETSSTWASSHAVTKYYIGESFYIMDDGTESPRGIFGPFSSLSESRYDEYLR